MDSVTDICKYNLVRFMTLKEVKLQVRPPGKKGRVKKMS